MYGSSGKKSIHILRNFLMILRNRGAGLPGSGSEDNSGNYLWLCPGIGLMIVAQSWEQRFIGPFPQNNVRDAANRPICIAFGRYYGSLGQLQIFNTPSIRYRARAIFYYGSSVPSSKI